MLLPSAPPLARELPRLARLLGESPEVTARAFDAVLRAIAAGAARRAAEPAGADTLLDAVLSAPFDTAYPALEASDPVVPLRVHGGTLVEASAAAVRLFGIGSLGRLVDGVAAGLPISTSSAARLPGLAVAALFAGWREALRRDGRDAEVLAALVAGGAGLAEAARAVDAARAAGWLDGPAGGGH